MTETTTVDFSGSQIRSISGTPSMIRDVGNVSPDVSIEKAGAAAAVESVEAHRKAAKSVDRAVGDAASESNTNDNTSGSSGPSTTTVDQSGGPPGSTPNMMDVGEGAVKRLKSALPAGGAVAAGAIILGAIMVID